MLTDLDVRHDYRSGRDSLLTDFYIPCLNESISYDRAVGFFRGSLLHVVAIAYSDFAQRGGHMRLICSPSLTLDDYAAMQSGMDMKRRAEQVVDQEIQEMLAEPASVSATSLLATLIGIGALEVRIAFSADPSGIFHDKLGIFEDENGRKISFVGSANETFAAWGLNHESFEVFGSWRGESELLRTRNHTDFFDRLWNNDEPGVSVEPLGAVTRERLVEVEADDLDSAVDFVRSFKEPTTESRPLYAHQLMALDNWQQAGRRGIVAFATGAGKTLTAIDAIRRWTASGKPAMVLVPGRDLHQQWAKEVAAELPDHRLLLVGAGTGADGWGPLVRPFSRDAAEKRIILATNASFASEEFQARLVNSGQHLLTVIDELHRAGSSRTLAALESCDFAAVLGLSATYQRQFDDSGTERLVAVCGAVVEPVIGLGEAIAMGLLVPYDYRLHTLTLEDDEAVKYELLTNRIKRSVAQSNESDGGMPSFLQMLLIQRARVLKQARGKVAAASAILRRDFKPGDRWLVYCDDTKQLQSVVDASLADGLPVMEYHSSMSGDRHGVLASLASNGGIVVAIRCLDEGVDIPSCDHALILASSTVEREYIQRRGRVLRSAPEKMSATIYDLLLTDTNGGALTRGEAVRALEFAHLARNPGARAQLALMVALSTDAVGLAVEELLSEEMEEL